MTGVWQLLGHPCMEVHMHFVQKHFVDAHTQKLKSVKWNSTHRQQQQFSTAEIHGCVKQYYIKHKAIMSYYIQQFLGGYRHWKRVNFPYGLQWKFHVLSHSDVSSHN
jgi:hypothetical protein